MYTKALIVAFAASLTIVNGAVVKLYSSPGCKGSHSSVNVFDNTCATDVPGFQSFKITSGGEGGQLISTYSENACALTSYACVSASSVGHCYNSFGNNFSGSNAVSSSPVCGTA